MTCCPAKPRAAPPMPFGGIIGPRMQSTTSTRTFGRVIFVGAGPGHPDLMTVRARRILEASDVVVHDVLVPRELLATVNPSAELIAVPRDLPVGSDPGTAIGTMLAELATSGRTVVRLKGGDPTVFARLAEELQPLQQAGVAIEIVPGVTAVLAAAAAAGIPLTSRTTASSATLVTGHEADAKESAIDFKALVELTGTIAVYMGVDQADAWSRALLDAGMRRDTPVTIVSRCSWPDQQIAVTSLERCAADFARHKWRPPAVAIVGEVAHGPLSARDRHRPFEGRRVLSPRPAGQGEPLGALVAEHGGCCIHLPAIRIEPPASWDQLDEAIRHADTFDWVVFSSANGVRAFLTRLRALGRDGRSLGTARLAAVGPATARALEDGGYACDLVPASFRAEGLVEALAGVASGGRFLLVRADQGRDVLRHALDAAGHHVTEAVAYRSTAIESLDAAAKAMLDGCPIDWIVITSPAIAAASVSLFGPRMREWNVASISPLTSAALAREGFPPTVEAAESTAEAIVEAMIAWELAHADQTTRQAESSQATGSDTT